MRLQDMAADALSGHRTTPALVADVLREAILTGVLLPGQPVRQEEVAARFGLSRSPVREALRQLEGEGLVKLYPHRGAVVVGVALDELRELVEIRVALETLAIRLALPHLTDQDLRRLDAIIGEADAMTDEQAHQRWGANNWDFHATLYAPAQRPRLFAMIKNLHMHVDRYVRVYFALAHVSERAQTDHRRILDACRNRDVERVTYLIERDIESVVEMLAQVLPESGAARPAAQAAGSGDAAD